jgi:polysaccharide biosynthesis protein PelC
MHLQKAIKLLWWSAILQLVLAVGGCSTLEHGPAVNLDRRDSWVILPISNHSETPQAGMRLESLLESQLRGRGITSLQRYPAEIAPELLFDPRESKLQEQALQWARSRRARYGVTGAINEWRYKVGVDGEPAVGLTLQIIDIEDGKVLYSASGARTGWSREALSAVAQKLTAEMLNRAGI